MRWPLVSRDAYDLAVSQLAREQAHCRDLDARFTTLWADSADKVSRATYEALLEKYHALKVVGAAPPEPPRVMVERPANPIMDAVSLAGGNDMERRAFLGSWATQQRLAGTNEDDIVHQLLNWKSVDEDDEPQADRMRS